MVAMKFCARALVDSRLLFLSALSILLFLSSAGCTGQSLTDTTATPVPAATSQPTPTPTATATATATVQPEPTDSPLPTLEPTATVPPILTPQPIAHVYTYTVQPGDTLTWILQLHGAYDPARQNTILANYAALNGLANPDLIQPNSILQIPINLHIVSAGESVSTIANQYNMTAEELQQLNPETIIDINIVTSGDLLRINSAVEQRDPNCDLWLSDDPHTLEGSPAVREVTMRSREQLLCISQRHGLSAATILKTHPEYINAIQNGDFGTNGLAMFIPNQSGATFLITDESMTLDYVTEYYDVSAESIYFWDGTPATERALEVDDRLFVPGVSLRGKVVFGSSPTRVSDVVADDSTQPSDPAENPSPAEPQPPTAPDPTAGNVYTDYPVGDPPPGAVFPSGPPLWLNSQSEENYCPPQNGFGWTGSAGWPTTSTSINPERGFSVSHPALDIVGAIGDPVYAAENGVVIWAGTKLGVAGGVIAIGHGNTWVTQYLHLNSVTVSCGQTVSRGQQIGTMGEAGLPHLHFEVRWQGFMFNPGDYTY
jgi:murein DD-endopeptidase MepM/ murein hydrolase activator NlpD